MAPGTAVPQNADGRGLPRDGEDATAEASAELSATYQPSEGQISGRLDHSTVPVYLQGRMDQCLAQLERLRERLEELRQIIVGPTTSSPMPHELTDVERMLTHFRTGWGRREIEVCYLYAVEDLTGRQIARRLGISPNTVKSHLRNAKWRLTDKGIILERRGRARADQVRKAIFDR